MWGRPAEWLMLLRRSSGVWKGPVARQWTWPRDWLFPAKMFRFVAGEQRSWRNAAVLSCCACTRARSRSCSCTSSFLQRSNSSPSPRRSPPSPTSTQWQLHILIVRLSCLAWRWEEEVYLHRQNMPSPCLFIKSHLPPPLTVLAFSEKWGLWAALCSGHMALCISDRLG